MSLLEATTDEGEVYEYLTSFLCKKNEDVESFLHNNAIDSERRSFSRTFLVIDEEKQGEIIGYFTLLVKGFTFLEDVSGTKRKLLTNNKRAEVFNSLLIAQLGRSDNYKGVIPGEEILKFALHNCELIYNLVALSIVCVEFNPDAKLVEFYETQSFVILQQNQENSKLLAYIKL